MLLKKEGVCPDKVRPREVFQREEKASHDLAVALQGTVGTQTWLCLGSWPSSVGQLLFQSQPHREEERRGHLCTAQRDN